MPPWVEKRAEGPMTHALVIGVSQYRHLPEKAGDASPTDKPLEDIFGLGQLTTPATAAMSIAEWLRDTYNQPDAPIGTIRLLLSPSEVEKKDGGLGALPASVLPATKQNVNAAITEWHADCATADENVAVMFAAGHGIELSPDDGGIVLLEDFAENPLVRLDAALDVGSIRRGMAARPMAQTQFYFVDACRVHPDRVGDFSQLNAGVTIDNPNAGAVECSPIYFSASPGEQGYGKLKAGTVFSEALIECLELLGVDRKDDQGRWFCSTTRIIDALRARVSEIGEAIGVQQTASFGGRPAPAKMHVLAEPPQMDLQIGVNPAAVAEHCHATVHDQERGGTVLTREPLKPFAIAKVFPGVYTVDVTVAPDAGYRDRNGWATQAMPPVPNPVDVRMEEA